MECYARLLKTTLIFGTGLYSGLLLAQDGGVGRVDPPAVIIEKTSGTIKNLIPERPPPCPPKNKEGSNLKKEKGGGGKGDSTNMYYVDEDSSESKYGHRGSKSLEDEKEVNNGKEPRTGYSEPKQIIEEKPTFKECRCNEQKQGDQETAVAAAVNASKHPCRPKKREGDQETAAAPAEYTSKNPCKPKKNREGDQETAAAPAENPSKKPCKPKKKNEPE